MPTKSKYLNRRRAAEYCGYAASTFNRLASEGKGPPYFVCNGRAMYAIAALDEWITGQPVDLDARRARAEQAGVES